MLPSGILVFLFTDIEGSTARWDTNGVAMQDAVRRHDAILRAAIGAHGGRIFKTVGDAFYATFAEVTGAFDAALAAQRALAAEDWSAVNGLRARMAIHAGDAEARDGDYFGPALNRVARLLSAGHGGQVLVSGSVAEHTSGMVPMHATLSSMGTFALKDLQSPETVYQLCADELPSYFKPLRSLETIPNNLPRQQTSFIGRKDDLFRAIELLESARLVTIIGTGGVGKTRLALQVATQRLAESHDGLWFVSFAAIGDPALIASSISSAMGIAQNERGPALDTLADHLKERRVQLVLDNCEHIAPDVAAIARAILERCPQISILATSREALNVPGERVYRLPSLSDDDSVLLFVDRARASVHDFEPDAQKRAIIEDICRRLDGIALAIELAASRVRMFSLGDIAQRLNERFRLLTGGSRTELPRHQTMRALIDWSYDLLDSGDKALFRRVSVFAGSFSFRATVGVCGEKEIDEWALLERLTSLVDKSLLAAEGDTDARRYHLLESIREYADEAMTASGERQSLSRRHAEYFTLTAEKAYDAFDATPTAEWLDRLRPDLQNFRAALAWTLEESQDVTLGARLAAALAPAFTSLSLMHEGLRWCCLARDRSASCPAHVRARLYSGIGRIENTLGAYREALEASELAVELYRQGTDDRAIVRSISQLAQQYARQDRYDDAGVVARDAIARARRLDDKLLIASALLYSANVFPAERIEEARGQYREAVEIFRDVGRLDEVSRALLWWAQSEAESCNLRRALDISLEALPLASSEVRFYLTTNIAGYALALEDHDRSAVAVPLAFELAKEQRHPIGLPVTIGYIAAVNAAEPAYAAPLLGYAQARLSKLGWTLSPDDAIVHERVHAKLREAMPESQLLELLDRGAGWTDERAIAEASRVTN